MVILRNKSTTADSLFDTALTVRHFKLYSYFTALLAVVTGGAIYILFRPVEPLFFTWANKVGAGNLLPNIRRFTLPLIDFIPNWILFSMPSGLWAFAYALTITRLWRDNNSLIKYFWFGSIPLLVIGYELLQYAKILQGVFCLNDLILSVVGISLGVLSGLKVTYKENKK